MGHNSSVMNHFKLYVIPLYVAVSSTLYDLNSSSRCFLYFRTFSRISPSYSTQFLAIEFSDFVVYFIIIFSRIEISYRVFSYHHRNHIRLILTHSGCLKFRVNENFAEFLKTSTSRDSTFRFRYTRRGEKWTRENSIFNKKNENFEKNLVRNIMLKLKEEEKSSEKKLHVQ